MKNNFLILSVVIGFSVSSYAEVQISVENYGHKSIQISTNNDNLQNTSISIDKGTQIIVDRKYTREEALLHYQRKIHRYEEKILKYHNKIKDYHEKIAEKPKKTERYQSKIENYQAKINEYHQKIEATKRKLREYQEIK